MAEVLHAAAAVIKDIIPPSTITKDDLINYKFRSTLIPNHPYRTRYGITGRAAIANQVIFSPSDIVLVYH